jgi:hypothetical protein
MQETQLLFIEAYIKGIRGKKDPIYSTRQLILKHLAPHQISTLPPTTSTLNCAIITSLICMKIALFNLLWSILSHALILYKYICLIILTFYMLATCYNISLYPC